LYEINAVGFLRGVLCYSGTTQRSQEVSERRRRRMPLFNRQENCVGLGQH